MARRSIIEFEKWLQEEIETVNKQLALLDEQSAGIQQRRGDTLIRLDTLKSVADKLTGSPEGEAIREELNQG